MLMLGTSTGSNKGTSSSMFARKHPCSPNLLLFVWGFLKHSFFCPAWILLWDAFLHLFKGVSPSVRRSVRDSSKKKFDAPWDSSKIETKNDYRWNLLKVHISVPLIQGVPSQMLFKESIHLSVCAEYLFSKICSEKVFLLQFLYAKD